MAKYVVKTAVVTVNSVDISDHCSEATIETTRDEVEVTGFGSAYKEFLAGLADATITLQVFQDYAAGETHATLFSLATSDTPFLVTVKPTNGAISTTNPNFEMTALIYTYNPHAGAVGQAATTPVVFRNASQTGVVADTTP